MSSKRIRRFTVSYLPDVYKEFKQQFPEIAKAYDELAVKCHGQGPLDEKTRRLIKLGIAIGLSSEGGVRSHARRALDEGISTEELQHAVLLAITTAGFPTMVAAMGWVEEVISKYKK
jgi:4-carboxymuconolactone decarboxylase